MDSRFHLERTVNAYFENEDILGAFDVKETVLHAGLFRVTIYPPEFIVEQQINGNIL